LTPDQTTEPELVNISSEADHFDPYQGFVDDGQSLNLRFGFRLGEINLLINKFTICEVVKRPIIYSMPNTPPWIQGLINLRGILVPVFDLKKILEQTGDDKKDDTLLIIDRGESAFATYIDDLPNSIDIDNEKFIKTSTPNDTPEILTDYISETFFLEQEIWIEIDYDAFIKNMTKDYSD
tara:strand:- start:53640 stop:54179 length:540 start_codon:yes stop_codon:yes gene_type:complete